MTRLPYEVDADTLTPMPIGLIVLKTDETLEPEFKRYFADHPAPIYATRIPSGEEVTTEMLAGMEKDLSHAASLLPDTRPYSVVGYGCTSASSVIGSEAVERLVQSCCDTAVVTNPLRAAIACAEDLGVSKLALLSPYIEEVNVPLRHAFANAGLSTDVFGTFAEPKESQVARINKDSIIDAALRLGGDPQVEAVFLSCTNLRTYDVIPDVEKRLGKPVLSSNQALAWHMRKLAPLS